MFLTSVRAVPLDTFINIMSPAKQPGHWSNIVTEEVPFNSGWIKL